MTDNNQSENDEELSLPWKRARYFARLAAAALVALAAVALFVARQPMPPKAVPILEYHMVATYTDDVSYEYNVPPTEFRRQLEWLRDNGYTTVSLLDLMKAKKGKLTLPEKPIVLTFDDGYDDNYYELLPILREYDAKATVFMITNNIGQEGYLTWDDLRELQAAGVEIGSHTANHLPLTKVAPERYEAEIVLSKLHLEWNGIKTVFFLSYPNGKYNRAVLDYLADTEFLGAVTGDSGFNTPDADPFLLRRVNIPHPHFGLTEFRWRLFKAEFMTKLKTLRW